MLRLNKKSPFEYIKILYLFLGIISGLTGILCIFYLPIVELGLKIDYGITVHITETFSFNQLRNTISNYGEDITYINISIGLIILGSIMKFIGIFNRKSILLGSILYILSFLTLFYKYNYKQSSKTAEIDFLYAEPTIWTYIIIILPVVLIIGFVILNLLSRSLNSNR